MAEHIQREQWPILNDVFWMVIPFGTGGRRGRMYPIGCNAINAATIGESAQGLADYVRQQQSGPHSCAIAYDTRHRSDEFARLCAEIMAANGFRVSMLDPYRSTPELSFAIRHFGCSCGIMVTASHNPPSDNAVKVYWSTGGQLLPPHDSGVIDCVQSVTAVHRLDFDEAQAAGTIQIVTAETDTAYLAAVAGESFPGPRYLRVVYSPLHGVGATATLPALAHDGFTDVLLYPPHAEADGDFPNVPGHVANPENTAVFDQIIDYAHEESAELIIASDPDCDRLGCATPVTEDLAGPWETLTGNQIGALLCDFVLRQRTKAKTLTPDHYVVKTLVTSDLVRKIADHYGAKTFGELHVGFKWIGGLMDEQGPEKFVLGVEESHGYLVGSYARDKDGVVAAMLLAELAAELKAEGLTLHQQLSRLFRQHGYHAERLINVQMPGADGMARMQRVMQRLRDQPPTTIAKLPVQRVRDYLRGVVCLPDGSTKPLRAPAGDMVMIDLDDRGNGVAVRPSGTEPKIKFYMFAVAAPGPAELSGVRREVDAQVDRVAAALREFVDSVP